MEVEASQPPQSQAPKGSEGGGDEIAQGVEWIAEESIEQEEPQAGGATHSRRKAKVSSASAVAAAVITPAPSEDYVTPGMPLSATFVLPEQYSGSSGATARNGSTAAAYWGGKSPPSLPQEVPQADAAAHSAEEEQGMQINEGVAAGAAEGAGSAEPAVDEAMEFEAEPTVADASGGRPAAVDPWQEDLQKMSEELMNDPSSAEKSKAAQKELQQMSEELENDPSSVEKSNAAKVEAKHMPEELKNDQSGAKEAEVAGEAVDPWLEDLQQMSEELKKDVGGAEKEAEAAGDAGVEAVEKPVKDVKAPQEQPKKGGRKATTSAVAAAVEAQGGSGVVGEGSKEVPDERQKKPSRAASNRRLTRIQKELAWSADMNESIYYGTDGAEAAVVAEQQQQEEEAASGVADVAEKQSQQKPSSGVSTRRRSTRRATMLKEKPPNLSLPSASGSQQEDKNQEPASAPCRRTRRASASSNHGPARDRCSPPPPPLLSLLPVSPFLAVTQGPTALFRLLQEPQPRGRSDACGPRPRSCSSGAAGKHL